VHKLLVVVHFVFILVELCSASESDTEARGLLALLLCGIALFLFLALWRSGEAEKKRRKGQVTHTQN